MRHALSLLSSFAIAALLFITASVIYAWTGPTAAPPNNNVPAPINVGTVDQIKSAGIGMNSLAVFGNAIISTVGGYLNFGPTVGISGYGFRDNAGTMEFKNSNGQWRTFTGAINGAIGPVTSIGFSDGTTQTTAATSSGGGGSGGGANRQVFTSSGTWTKPASGSTAMVECWGGGAGGGKFYYSEAVSGDVYVGGQGGRYEIAFLPLSSLPASVPITIGAGGAGSPAGPNDQLGKRGGDSSFGAYLAASSGAAGGESGNWGSSENGCYLSAAQSICAGSPSPPALNFNGGGGGAYNGTGGLSRLGGEGGNAGQSGSPPGGGGGSPTSSKGPGFPGARGECIVTVF